MLLDTTALKDVLKKPDYRFDDLFPLDATASLIAQASSHLLIEGSNEVPVKLL